MEAVDIYVQENSLRESSILKELREYTLDHVQFSIMLSEPIAAQLFQMLLKMLGAKKCLEVGTYTGYNALNCALTIPQDGVVYALDINEEFVRHGYPFFEKAGVKDKIEVRIGAAIKSMEALLKESHGETFDFIYIDAEKTEYEEYLERAFLLLRTGGVIAVDNTLQAGRVVDMKQEMTSKQRREAEAIHNFNKNVACDERFQISFLSIGDGVTLLRRL